MSSFFASNLPANEFEKKIMHAMNYLDLHSSNMQTKTKE